MKSPTSHLTPKDHTDTLDAPAPGGSEPLDGLATRVTRRSFMQAAAVSVGALVMAGKDLPAMAAAGGRKATVTRYPLRIPGVFAPSGTLTCAPASVDMGDGKLRTILA